MQIDIYLKDSAFSIIYQGKDSGRCHDLVELFTVINPQYVARRKLCNMKGWEMPKALICSYVLCSDLKSITVEGKTTITIEDIPYGLLSILKKFIKRNKISTNVVPQLVTNTKLLTAKNIPLANKYDLRDYQIDAAERMLALPYGLCKAVTGSGKTRIMTAIAASLNVPTVILMYSKSLVNQWYDQFKSIGIEPMRVYEGKVKKGKNNNIIVGTFQSMCEKGMVKKGIYWRHHGGPITQVPLNPRLNPGLHGGRLAKIKKLLPGFPECVKAVMVDEAHSAPSITYYSALQCFNPIWRYGCTATPYREGGDTLMMYAMFSDRIVDVDFQKVKNYLTIPTLVQVEFDTYLMPQDINEKEKYLMGADFVRLLCSDMFRLLMIVKVAELVSQYNRQFLIVCGYMWLVNAVNEQLIALGIHADVVAGETNIKEKDREAVKARLANRESPGVISTTTFDVGVDVPTLEVVIFAYPFNSKTRVIQRVGRVARKAAEKTSSLVIDIVDVNFDRTKQSAANRARILADEFEMKKVTIPQGKVGEELRKML